MGHAAENPWAEGWVGEAKASFVVSCFFGVGGAGGPSSGIPANRHCGKHLDRAAQMTQCGFDGRSHEHRGCLHERLAVWAGVCV